MGFRLANHHSHVSQFLKIHAHTHPYHLLVLCLFLGNPNVMTDNKEALRGILSRWPLFSGLVCMCTCSVTQSCPTPCDPVDSSPPGSSVHGILQARILEWVATSFSGVSSQHRDWPRSISMQADSLPSESPGEPLIMSAKDPLIQIQDYDILWKMQ